MRVVGIYVDINESSMAAFADSGLTEVSAFENKNNENKVANMISNLYLYLRDKAPERLVLLAKTNTDVNNQLIGALTGWALLASVELVIESNNWPKRIKELEKMPFGGSKKEEFIRKAAKKKYKFEGAITVDQAKTALFTSINAPDPKPGIDLQGLTAMIGGGPVDLGAMTVGEPTENTNDSDGKTKLLPDMPEGVAEQLKVIPEDVKLDIPKVYKGDMDEQ